MNWKNRKTWAVIIGLVALACLVLLFRVSILWGVVLTILAPFFVFGLLSFTIVKEGTAKVVLKASQFSKIFVQWKGKTVDENGDIVEGREWHLLGGIRWFGFWPFYTIYQYDFEWTGVKPDGTFEFHPKERLDRVLLKDDVYGCSVEKAEDKELLPLDIALTLTVQIVNPYKALFAVQNWFETMVNRITPYVREFVTHWTYQELVERPEVVLDVEVWKALIKPEKPEEGIIYEFQNRYGILIRKLETRDINPGKEYRNVTLKRLVAARGAEARSQETSGVITQMLCQATGKTVEQIQAEVNADPAVRKEFLAMVQDLLNRRIAIDGNAFVDIRVQGASGVEQTLLNLLSTWRRMPGGKGMPGSGSSAGDESDRIKGGKEDANSPENDPKGSLPEHLEEELKKWESKYKKP